MENKTKNVPMIGRRIPNLFCYFRLNVFSQESVPLFGPPLPTPPEFYDFDEFRDFLLVKRKYPLNCPVALKINGTCKWN